MKLSNYIPPMAKFLLSNKETRWLLYKIALISSYRETYKRELKITKKLIKKLKKSKGSEREIIERKLAQRRPAFDYYYRYLMSRALINTLYNRLKDKRLAKALLPIISAVATGPDERRGLGRKYKTIDPPPGFLTISPNWNCNLRCRGCYANSPEVKMPQLDYETFLKIIDEAKKYFGLKFFVISGGEPLAYKSKDRQGNTKVLEDVIEKNKDCYFLFFTNGMLLTKERIKRIAELGNVTPSISIEGFAEETDARRGKGVYEKLTTDVMPCLREHGIFFGISTTPTRQNIEHIYSDEFVNFALNNLGAGYIWNFQYCPIGFNPSPELIVTPEQYAWATKKVFEHVKKGRFVVGFVESGSTSLGCVAAGGADGGGHFHIIPNGDIHPCPFFVYGVDNINKIYKEGKSLIDVYNSKFFSEIRKWQRDYKARPKETSKDKINEWKTCLFLPCPIRSHYSEAVNLIKKNKATSATDKGNYLSKKMEKFMIAYNANCSKEVAQTW